jgi:hypothetical protein
MIKSRAGGNPMTVWIYINTAKEVGEVDHLKVFASEDAAERWFAEHDPEVRGVRVSGDGVI